MFWKNLIRNILLLGALLLILFLVAPSIMRQVYDMLGQLFGPLLILIIIVAALPRRSRSTSRQK